MESTEHLVRAHIGAFNRGDLPALLDGLAEDVVWITGADVFQGRSAVHDFLADAVARLHPQLHIRRVISEGSQAGCELYETYEYAGETCEGHLAAFFDFAGTVIRRVKVYREGSADP
jgi:ketosteroid isomerase-like protein